MRLKLDQLQDIVKSALSEESVTDSLRTEVSRVLGPIMDISLKLEGLAEAINERLDVLDRTGRNHAGFDVEVMSAFSSHNNDQVRKMAARLLPEDQIKKFTSDKSSVVRTVVAQRLPLTIVREMMRSFPTDEEVRLVYSRRINFKKSLLEGLDEEEFDIHGEEPLGDSGKTWEGVELSDVWYHTKAQDLVHDYSRYGMIDYNWEERAVSAFCEHSRATSGVEIDPKKLFDAVQDIIKEKEDRALAIQDVYLKEAYDVRSNPGGSFDVVDEMGQVVETGFESAMEAQQAATGFEDEIGSHYDEQSVDMHDEYSNDMKPRVESALGGCIANLLREAVEEEGEEEEEEDIREGSSFALPRFVEAENPIKDLLEANYVGSAYIEKFAKLFDIKEATVPAAIKKFILGEGTKTRRIPSKARLPHNNGLGVNDEKALDMYVEAWNDAQIVEGEPFKLYWNADPCDANFIGFNLILR